MESALAPTISKISTVVSGQRSQERDCRQQMRPCRDRDGSGAVSGWSSADFGFGGFGLDIFPMVFGFGDSKHLVSGFGFHSRISNGGLK